MKSVKDLLEKYVIDDYGHVQVPEDINDRNELGKALFGASLIHALDFWLNDANDLIENPQPAEPYLRKNEAYRIDKSFRETLSTLSEEQKNIIKKLIQRTATGLLFNILVDLDQFDYGQIKMQIKPKQLDNSETELNVLPTKFQIHDELNEWIFYLSKYSNELVEKVEGGYELKN